MTTSLNPVDFWYLELRSQTVLLGEGAFSLVQQTPHRALIQLHTAYSLEYFETTDREIWTGSWLRCRQLEFPGRVELKGPCRMLTCLYIINCNSCDT